ncbi:hypothetical protein ACVMGC_004766 [Bradyrhizobium barranii subsp. barranii]|uniref:hypothetical protein n=1 Tax=Bradyrhizobium liaoningense TaxID=43992 RepID=UPI001BA6F17D|nr:hypothetical protein [Bradyrhizobium liaoningense]MBR0879102.1 hypothetical protein [Bradyrhizobium liaoningense]
MSRVEIVFVNPLHIVSAPPPEGHALLTIAFNRFVITAEGTFVMYTLPVDHAVRMQVGYVDAAGNPATVDGAVSWATSNPDLAQVEVDSQDSTICRVVPVAELGQVQITATADADLGSGVRELITVCDITIVAGEAVTGTIQPVGEPEPIPPARA